MAEQPAPEVQSVVHTEEAPATYGVARSGAEAPAPPRSRSRRRDGCRRGHRGPGAPGAHARGYWLPRSQRARPTHFVAIQLKSREIQRCVEQLQQWFVAQNKLFERCLVPIRRMHTALLLTSFEDSRLHEARQAYAEAAKSIREFLGGEALQLKVEGVGCFGGRVVFARVRTEPPELLEAMHHLLSRTFLRHGFPVLDDTGQAWLRPGEEPRQFRGHSSFLKVSKAISHSRSKEERESFKALHVSDEDLAPFRSTHLGSQLCSDIELLAMLGSAQDGYYPRLRVEKLPGEVLPEMEVVGDDDPRAALESAWSGEPQDSMSPEDSPPEESRQASPATSRTARRNTTLALEVWQVVAQVQVLTIEDLLMLAAVAQDGLQVVQAVVCKVKVMLFSEAGRSSLCFEGSCLDWDRVRTVPSAKALQIRDVEEFLAQPASEQLAADVGFVENSQQLIFGKTLEGLQSGLREALPFAFGKVEIHVGAVRNISIPIPAVLETICAAQPEIIGLEGLGLGDLPSWVQSLQKLNSARVLVHAWTNRDVDSATHFQPLLEALSSSSELKGLDFQNLACTFHDFPAERLPRGCIAFGTIVLQKDMKGLSARGSMDFHDFVGLFPRFPPQVSIVRASLGTKGHWSVSAQAMAEVFRAKFPGLQVLQLELSLQHSKDSNDVPFIDLSRALIQLGVKVEVTKIRCRAAQYEFLRAAMKYGGALVNEEEDEGDETVYPFSHPRFDWSKVVSPG
ncbi:unnamed protein product [Durusdinium trenchii]|uniref:A-kinase anchor protein 7-like phosphoesterase domain-containing protein n=1 Tax=Durusdinium trenchii TaxID=1381693 RepID=A0ABP0P190_9DINO